MASSITLTTSRTLMMLLSPSVAAPVSVALMNLLSPRIVAAFSVRSLSTSTPPTTSGSDSISDSKSVSQLVNQFMKKESTSIPYKLMKDKEAMHAIWDMPGIRKEGLKVWIEDNYLHVNGEEGEEKSFSPLAEECRRKYYGNMDINQGSYKVEEIAAELRNGVLKVKIPKRDIINVKVNSPSCSKIHTFWYGPS